MGRRKLDENEKKTRLLLKETKTTLTNEHVTKKRGRKSKDNNKEYKNRELDLESDFFSDIINKSEINNIDYLNTSKTPGHCSDVPTLVKVDFNTEMTLGKNDEQRLSVPSSVKTESKTGLKINVFLPCKESKDTIKIKTKVPWIEKYRPKTIDDILLDECLYTKIKNLIKMDVSLLDGSESNINQTISCLPNIIITGTSGIGKTSTLFCIAKEILGDKYSEGLLELNASDNRGLDIINNSIIHFCKKKINGLDDQSPVKKIIIFDEADNITKKAQNILANMMEEYSETTRFCFTCNDSANIIESIQSRCLILHYKPLSREHVLKKLKMICLLEKINYLDKGLEAIIFISHGDIRQAINNLEATYNSYNMITEENVYKLCYQPHPKTVIALIQKCATRNLNIAIIKYEELKEQGYCNSDIIQTMINVLKLINIDEHIRINFIKILSDTYINITEGIDTDLQLYGCISKMILYIESNS
jgi:replication factor C subunit 2/4